jgi:hypothetical protein
MYTRIKRLVSRIISKAKHSKAVFGDIYEENLWNDPESRSGSGSSMQQTAEIRIRIPELLHELNARSMFDAPCGDFYWMKAVDLDNVDYIGGDIVESLAIDLNKKFGSPKRRFVSVDITKGALPDVDVMLCRDCLVHLPYEHISAFISNLQKSNIKYLLTTTFPGRQNVNIKMGNWRPLDLQRAPFHFPPPVTLINEKCTQGNGLYSDKSLGLWKVSELRAF